MALVNLNFESQFLNGNTEVSIILPDKPRTMTPAEFYGSGAKYKVLWLLHGTYGDHSDWIRKSSIELYACEKDLIVVMPSALNSDYVNWPNCMMGYNMFDYLTEELMPLVYNWFPASDKREDNFVAGLSMGGAGTLIYALNHPDKFAGAAVLSAGAWNYARQVADPASLENPRFVNSIANAGGAEGLLASVGNTWRILGEKVGKEDLPRMYCAVGKNDFLYDRYLEFKAYAEELGAGITFEEFEGYTHEWRFWDLAIQKALTFFGLDATDQGNPF